MNSAINPAGLAEPRGYSNGMLLPPGRTLFVAGQIGWNARGQLVSDDFGPQFEQALNNVLSVVREAGGTPEHVGRLTIYVTDKAKYNAALKQVGEAYRSHMGKHYPAMTLVQVADLLEPGALVELEATAVLP